jgi:GT2 family glycosyltransferase
MISAVESRDDVVSAWSRNGGRLSSNEDGGPPALRRGITVAVCTYRRRDALCRFLTSLGTQERQADALVIVDASPEDDTERALAGGTFPGGYAGPVTYLRVTGTLRGLTRQRNVALRRVDTDLVAFFDDDIVLESGCLAAMEHVHRTRTIPPVGVAARMAGGVQVPDAVWRMRRALGMVSTLTPGSYQRSGMSIPWAFLPTGTEDPEGDVLPGGATMWNTVIARSIGFHEVFEGYAQGEDLDFSLQAARHGALILATGAHLRHEHETGGRPDAFRLGYMAIFNRFVIHRRGLRDRTWRDIVRFIYAWSLDTVMLLRHCILPSRIGPTMKNIAGRGAAAFDLLRGVHRRPSLDPRATTAAGGGRA